MMQEQDNPYPDDAAVFVRYPTEPVGPDGYGPSSEWPWLPGEIMQRCGEDEWQVAVLDKRFATLEDGSEVPEGHSGENLYYPTVFRESDDLMPRPDDGSTPDGPVGRVEPQAVLEGTRKRLAHDVLLIATRLTEYVTSVNIWAGAGAWASVDEPGRASAGVGSLYNLITTLCQLSDVCIRLHHAGCASTHYNYDQLVAARELLLEAARPGGMVIDADTGDPVDAAVNTQPPGESAENPSTSAQLGGTPTDSPEDARWMSYFDAIMNFDNAIVIDAPPKTDE